MQDLPTQQQIDEIMRRAHVERARFMLNGIRWIGSQIATPFRSGFARPAERHS